MQLQIQKLLQPGHLLNWLPGPPSAFYLLIVAAFLIWTFASSYIYVSRRRLFIGNGASIGMATEFGPYAIAIGGIGLFLLLMRYLGVPYLSIRAILYLNVLVAIGFLGFLAYYVRVRYPARLAKVRSEEMRRRYAQERKRGKRKR